MIKMGYGEHHLNHLTVTIIYNGMVLTSAELTAVVGTLKYLLAYFTPVLGVSVSILRAYWHMYHLLSISFLTSVEMASSSHDRHPMCR